MSHKKTSLRKFIIWISLSKQKSRKKTKEREWESFETRKNKNSGDVGKVMLAHSQKFLTLDPIS